MTNNSSIDDFIQETLNDNSCKKNKFISEKSKDINIHLIQKIESTINRTDAIIKIDDILGNIEKSMLLEFGIFEFSLVYALSNNISDNIIPAIYNDTIENIILNIDPESRISNVNLKKTILNGDINPQYIAFLTPEQLNPELWKNIVNKKQYETDKERHKITSEAYTCYRCGEKKCRITQLQTRSADEPMTTFVSCQICYNTFTR